eukprot:2802159-Prymnesium_polylepis.1
MHQPNPCPVPIPAPVAGAGGGGLSTATDGQRGARGGRQEGVYRAGRRHALPHDPHVNTILT